MVDKVGGNSNKISIKLASGQTIDLAKIDKLVGQSTTGTIWDSYAGADHILQKEEVDIIKNKFLSASTNGSLNQAELNTIFDQQRQTDKNGNKKDFDENLLATTFQDIPDDGIFVPKSQPPSANKNSNNSSAQPNVLSGGGQVDNSNVAVKTTKYKIQPGDTPENLADKFGLKDKEAEEFIQNMRQQLNGRKYFSIGEDVVLPGEQQEKIEQLRSSGNYTENEAELDARYEKTRPTRVSTHRTSGQTRSSKPQAPQYPQSVQNVIKNVNAVKGQYNVTKNDDGSYSIVIKGTNFTKQHGCSSYVIKYDAKGNRLSQTNNYANGRVLEGIKGANGKYTWREKTPIKGDALKMFNTVQNKWHGQAQVVYTKNGYNIVATGTDYEKKNDIATYVYSYNRGGKLLSKTRTYNDGKEQKSIPKNGKDNWVTTKEAKKGYFDKFTDWVSETWDNLTSSNTTPAKKTVPAKKSTNQTRKKTAFQPKKLSFEDQCRKYLQINELGYPKGIQKQLIKYREQGIGATVEQTRNGFRMTLNEDEAFKFGEIGPDKNALIAYQRKSDRALPYNKDKKVLDFDKKGNIVQLTQDYPHKVVTTPYSNGKPSKLSPMLPRTEMKEPAQYSKLDGSRTFDDRVPADLSIELPERWKDDEGVQAYAQSLIDNKPTLMKELGLTNAQYDDLVSLAFGVTEQETHFETTFYKNSKNEWNYNQTQVRLNKKRLAKTTGLINGENHSYGVAQINYWAAAVGNDPNDPSIKTLRKQLADFGINGHKDYENNPAKAAVAQLIILNNKRKTAESAEWQNLIKKLNARIKDPSSKITTDDVTAVLYNGAGNIKARMLESLKHPAGTPEGTYDINTTNSGKLDKNGDEIKDGMSYARLVRAYRNTFKISSSQYSKNRSAALGAESQSNYGDLGIVVFMPKAYNSKISQQGTLDTVKNIQTYFNVSKTTPTAKQKANANVANNQLMNNLIAQKSNAEIKTSLSEAKIKALLIEAVENQEVAFGGKGGLTASEAKSIHVDDAILILKNVALLRSQIAQGNITNKAQIRELAQVVDGKFHSSYMQSHQVVVNKSDVAVKHVLSGFASSETVNERISEHWDNVVSQHRAAFRKNGKGSYQTSVDMYNSMDARGVHRGFKVVADKGVDPYLADGTILSRKERQLAEVASDIASKDLASGGQCATGIKAAWQSAGIIKDRNEVVYPRNITRRIQSGDTLDGIVNSVGLTSNKSKANYKAKLIKRLKAMAKIDSKGNLIAGKTIQTRANITIKAGDTLDAILQRCGYTKDTPANAKEYNRKLIELKKQLKTDGMLDANGKPMPMKTTTKNNADYFNQIRNNLSFDGIVSAITTDSVTTPNTFSFSAKAVVKEGDTLETLASRFGHTKDKGRYIANLKRELQQSVVLDDNNNLISGKNIIVHVAGEPIEVAKDLSLYMDAHPENFEQVKYVDTGKGQARELTAADIKNLPAGITGVFIPGAGYEEQSGHAFISNGNGQGYADEVDNLGWANFVSGGKGNGKGEHGYVKFYRIAARLRK